MTDASVLSLLQNIAARLGSIEDHLGLAGGAKSGGGGGADELPRSIKAFDAYCVSSLDPFVTASTKLGGDAEKLGGLTREVWMEMRAILLRATACKEPTQQELMPLLGGVSSKIQAIGKLTSRNEWEKHCKTVSEGVQCVNWLCVKPAPRDFIETFIGGSDYWANGIRKEFRATNPDQIAFCDTFKALITELMAYVKEFHTTGVSWNAKGVAVNEFSAAAAASKPVAAAAAAAKPAGGVNMFAALNKGGDITSGLKTVTKDQQTWRAEYKGDAPVVAKKAAVAPRVVEKPKGPANVEFQGGAHKWVVEFQDGSNGTTQVTIGDKKESVYIFGCIGAKVHVSGKCKSIIVDGCKKTDITFDDVMASFEVVNCQRIKVYCLLKAAAVAIDKTDGIVVHLPRESLDTEIVSSKSSEMNVSWPGEDGEMIEKPIPEQFVHRIKGLQITAEISDLYS